MGAVSLGLGTLIAGVAGGGAVVYGAHKAGEASEASTAAQERANAEAMAVAEEQERVRREEFEAQQVAAERQWEAAQAELSRQAAIEEGRWDAREARLSPYREAGAAAVGALSQRAGLSDGAPVESGPRPFPGSAPPVAADASVSDPARPSLIDDPRLIDQTTAGDLMRTDGLRPEILAALQARGARMRPGR